VGESKKSEAKSEARSPIGRIDLDNPERKGQFFIEWRVSDPSIAKGVSAIQREVKKLVPDVQLGQSCAVDNMHITMNQLSLGTNVDESKIQQLVAVIKKFETEDFRTIIPNSTSVKMLVSSALSHFKERVIYAPVSSDQEAFKGDVLVECFNCLQKRLVSAGFNPITRPLKPHLTVCKAPAKAKKFDAGMLVKIMKLGDGKSVLGTQWLSELVLCVKRTKSETTPPIIYRVKSKSSNEST